MSDALIQCPCCGQPRSSPGQWVSTSRLVAVMWEDEPSGGPLTAARIVAVRAAQARPMLRAYRLEIESHKGSGYRLVKQRAPTVINFLGRAE